MKILLIGFTKLAYMPYMNFYLEQVSRENNEVHLLYWNRDEKEEIPLPYDVKLHEYRFYQEDEVAKIKKTKSFLGYRKRAKQLMLRERFDLIIVMHTLPGVLLYDILKKYYDKKYILDYRDVTFESIRLYKGIIHKLVNYSIATFVSSDAFRVYLPEKDNIYTSHNVLLDSLKNRDIRRFKERCIKPIRIRYWGFIRHENINKAVIDRLANDNRFELHYHGREQETARNLKKHCKKYGIRNVFFHGEYRPEERYKFAKDTDLIHNLFDNDKVMKPAMSNKFYDGITFYIPQICNEGSFMGEQVVESQIGYKCNPYTPSFADEIYDYYNTIQWSIFEENCNKKIDKIISEYQNGIDMLANITKLEY